jgi:hypothetical protein
MELYLPFKGGGSPSEEGLTAKPQYVREGKTFIGAGSDDPQTGTGKVYTDVNKSLAANGSLTLPAGFYDGDENKVTQKLTTQDATTITPTADGQTVNTKNKYYTGDITVAAVSNFRPEVIKYGVTVGEGDNAITGTWQGFVD